MGNILFTNGLLFDGGLDTPQPMDVLVEEDYIKAVFAPGQRPEAEQVVDCRKGVLMPGLIDAHTHIDFGASLGRIPKNPFKMPPYERMLSAIFAAKTMIDFGYTSAYSGGCIGDVRADISLKDEIDSGRLPGPRIRSCAGQWTPGTALGHQQAPFGVIDRAKRESNPQAARNYIKEMADTGVEIIKFGLNGESGLVPGTTQTLMFYEDELAAAMDEVHKAGLWASAHAYTDEAVRMALKNDIRVLYHCAFMDEKTIEMIVQKRDGVFVAPGPGILWATIHQANLAGFTAEDVERMEAQITLDAGCRLMPTLNHAKIRVLPGGDYGFPWNPIGQNARDLSLFVSDYQFTPLEALHAATALGGELMNLPVGQIREGYLADMIIVRGNPVENISLLQDKNNIEMVMKGGRILKGEGRF